MSNLENQKNDLIDLIIWYRDKYHKSDSIHSDLIERVSNCKSINSLYEVWDVVDRWLDFSDR